MKAARPDFSTIGFARTYILPSLLVFLIPILSLLFFRHVVSISAIGRCQ